MKYNPVLLNKYNQLQAKYPDCILLYRIGDFYEIIGDKATLVSSIIGTPLVKRNNYSVTGFAYFSLDNYLPKLVRAGNRVAICDELTNPVI